MKGLWTAVHNNCTSVIQHHRYVVNCDKYVENSMF